MTIYTHDEQAQRRSKLGFYLKAHLEQLEADYHRPMPEAYSRTAHAAMQEGLAERIVELRWLLHDIPNIEFHEPVR